jgi:predicted AAA+ superfamily ATPase
VSSKTIKGYYEILVDTLVAIKLEPYLKGARKRIIKHPKYYLFDQCFSLKSATFWECAHVKTFQIL